MSEYVFRYADGFGCDMSDLMDGGRVTAGDYFASENTDHYGTLHEEIVRCRDCEFGRVHDGRGAMYCIRWSDGYQGEWTEPDGYCHKAVRRNDDDNGRARWAAARGRRVT